MKKFFSIILISFLLISQTFAIENEICNQSPQLLDNYFSSIISILDQATNKAQNQSSWIKALWAKLAQTGLWAIVIASIFWLEGTFSNFFPSFIIIFHQSYIVRDWAKLINFKKYITKTALELARKWALEENLPKNIKTQLEQISQNNIYILYKTSSLKNINNYENFLKFIYNNQIKVENIFFKAITSIQLNTTFSGTNNDFDPKKINLLYNKLKNTYKPWGKEVKCELIVKYDFKKFKNITKRFDCNFQRLKNALFGTKFENKECENYWNVKLVKWWHIWVKWKISVQGMGKILIDATTETWAKLIDTSKFKTDIFNQIIENLSHIKNNIKNLRESLKIKKITPTKINLEKVPLNNFIDEINTITQTVSQSSQQASYILTKTDSTSFTFNLLPKIPNTSYYIWKSICTIDSKYPWCEDSSQKGIYFNYPEKGIYQNLVETCENQSPFQWNCRY